MGDQDRGETIGDLKSLDLGSELHTLIGIQVTQWLIKKDNLGMSYQGATYRDALLCATREGVDLNIADVLKSEKI